MGENTTSSINGAVNIEVHMEKELNYTAILHHSQKPNGLNGFKM